jgi:hypothetical protein
MQDPPAQGKRIGLNPNSQCNWGVLAPGIGTPYPLSLSLNKIRAILVGGPFFKK